MPNHIAVALDELDALYWLDGLSADISGIFRRYNRPAPPNSDMVRNPKVLPFLRLDRVGDLGGYEQKACDAFNSGVIAAYRCVGWKHVGLLTAIANETSGTKEWNAYYANATDTINGYFRNNLAWEDFDAYVLEPAQKYLKASSQG